VFYVAMDKATLGKYLENGLSLREIGELVERDPSTVGYWVKKYGLVANGREKYAPKGGLRRAQLAELAEQGATLQEMADAVERSVPTVRYWLRKYKITTTGGSRKRRRVQAMHGLDGQERSAQLDCHRHGITAHVLEGRGYFRCKRCRLEAVSRRRRKVKTTLVTEAGGACAMCGYSRCQAALHFHHIDPSSKEFNISLRGVTLGIDRVRQEVRKCILLCSNCHAEVELGLAKIPERHTNDPG
jgi:transposase